MIEKEFNDRIYTKSTAKREKYTIFMLQNIGLFPLLDSATHVRIQKKPPELLQYFPGYHHAHHRVGPGYCRRISGSHLASNPFPACQRVAAVQRDHHADPGPHGHLRLA